MQCKKYAEICTLKYAKICKNMQKCASTLQVWILRENMQKYAKNMQLYAKYVVMS